MEVQPNTLANSQGEFTTGDSSGIKALIWRLIKILSPRLYWDMKLGSLRREDREYEMQIAPLLCNPSKVSIDIGADDGSYSVRICERSAHVVAFEPRPAQAAKIREMVTATRLPIEVEAVALSNDAGLARLRILKNDAGRSTIESTNTLEDPDGSPRAEIRVPKLRLDDYEMRDVGFIKIDVEGHELAVLQGGIETIRACMPILLIEIEDRHRANAVSDVSAFLVNLGYECFFILDGEVVPFAQFDKNVHQDPANIGGWKDNWVRRGIYINNFFSVPAGSSSALSEAAASVKYPWSRSAVGG
jgi:FkbM family methyltransferase